MRSSEQQLIADATRGDSAALGQLLSLHQQRLYNVCLRMVGHRDDAAEVAQDAMVKIVEHIGDFKGQAAFTTWMTRIAMNLSVSHLRKRKLRRTASLDEGYGRNGDGQDQATALRHALADEREPRPEQRVQEDERSQRLHAALGRLEEDFRAVLVLRDLQEMDYLQIATVLSVPVGTVKSRLFRARLALRNELLKDEAHPAETHSVAPGQVRTSGLGEKTE